MTDIVGIEKAKAREQAHRLTRNDNFAEQIVTALLEAKAAVLTEVRHHDASADGPTEAETLLYQEVNNRKQRGL